MATSNEILEYLVRQFGDVAIDPRYGRTSDIPEIEKLRGTYIPGQKVEIPQRSLTDFEGHPYVIYQSDRTDANKDLINIKGENLKNPVRLQGGQDFMFTNDKGLVWASDPEIVKKMLARAGKAQKDFKTDKPVLFMPYRMSPTGGDFASMTGEAMMRWAQSTMNKRQKAKVNKIFKKYIPEFKGIDSEEGFQQFRSIPGGTRVDLIRDFDKGMWQDGGLRIGEARALVSAPDQFGAPDIGLQNVGLIDPKGGYIDDTGHLTYKGGLPGEGVGRIKENLTADQLLPDWMKDKGFTTYDEARNAQRSLSMTGKNMGILDEKTLKALIGGGTLLGAAGANASPVPGGLTAPDMGKVREGLDMQRQSQKAAGVTSILDFIDPAFIMPQPLGGGLDTMQGYSRSQTR